MAQDTAHRAQHTKACTPVNRSQAAQDTVHATQHTERAQDTVHTARGTKRAHHTTTHPPRQIQPTPCCRKETPCQATKTKQPAKANQTATRRVGK